MQNKIYHRRERLIEKLIKNPIKNFNQLKPNSFYYRINKKYPLMIDKIKTGDKKSYNKIDGYFYTFNIVKTYRYGVREIADTVKTFFLYRDFFKHSYIYVEIKKCQAVNKTQ